jgi:hypothetical protein
MKRALVACEDAMIRISRAVIAAAGMALAIVGAAAQTTPVDPLAPGAAVEEAQSDNAKPSAAAEKPTAAKPARHKPQPRSAGGLTVVVSNKRSVGLVELKVSPAGDPDPKKVAGPLAFGRKSVAHLRPAKDCLYDIRGHFADDADTEQLGVELCKDKAINLTDE